ncbi:MULTISPECIES: response regulator transcription factor [Clostridium]|uniref:Stage 0 sporulation protein A homolog n=3 Tax=Clostridium TaxID=1485 RepID=D8GRH5_CLOLD|nr:MULTISPECIES: response regulator transcription factor [Clostridium]ADK16343.1 predicted two-component response regulator [Clostridium ljungdahlii DSM 13528]AGY75420.1 response regulator transcription factor [Clostridium autoethanogenum DSM 10061]ALU35586.1 Two component transcriptional regulator [Clostridium autoethanogenum DSM 10061]OAA89783.1 Alkaline phosphatase synthesis transcriptional regulatory protein PhoP [Clostridium ljungdahlii DSM 13528]OAA94674.1 Alkaline phosphatase synthesis 
MDSTILVVDDDKDILDIIEIYLKNDNFNVITAQDGLIAMDKLEKNNIDLIILDIMMPNLDGIHACLEIRKKEKIPIIMLSAKDDSSSKILGLNVGADDYVTKPFNPLELVARVKSQIRRYSQFNMERPQSKEEIVIDDMIINTASREVFIGEKLIELTPIEFSILEVLANNRGRVLSTESIYESVWKEPFYNAKNTVAVHIRNIREKIEINSKDPKYIKVVWGVGYKIDK